MVACWARQIAAERLCAQSKTPVLSSIADWLPSNSFRGSSRETVYSVERETGLEPATACLEGRRLQYRRSLDLHRPDSRFHTIHSHCERAWQKMSRAFFSQFGKTCHVFLPSIPAKGVARNLRQEVTLLLTLYLISCSLAMISRK